jgi:seryl-tRNA synthetase
VNLGGTAKSFVLYSSKGHFFIGGIKMIDIRLIRDNVEQVIERLQTRQKDFSYLRDVVKMDARMRKALVEVEELKAKRNDVSKQIGELKRQRLDALSLMDQVAGIGKAIQALDESIEQDRDRIHQALLETPNIPHSNAIVGTSERDNVEVRTYLTPSTFSFAPQAHWDIAERLDLIDFERGVKIAGPRFVVYKGLGARLERALMQFMMDTHAIDHGYVELIPPYINNKESLTATGQLPKFEEDLFKVNMEGKDYYLNPTCEVPAINFHRDEVLKKAELPLLYVGFTTAFRKEAGAAGRDTRGIIRLHQFSKVELIAFTTPEQGYVVHEQMLRDAEKILQLLELPYRVIELCTGDLGAAMAKTYDIEVWLPSYDAYKEIASISNAETYQARRANIRYKDNAESKPEFVHTLNGSGLAVGRTVVAILENYQQADGSIRVPKVLQPYMKTDVIK